MNEKIDLSRSIAVVVALFAILLIGILVLCVLGQRVEAQAFALRWRQNPEQPVEDIEYLVYRYEHPDSIPGVSDFMVSTPDTSIVDTAVVAGKRYWYRIRARRISNGAMSDMSNPATGLWMDYSDGDCINQYVEWQPGGRTELLVFCPEIGCEVQELHWSYDESKISTDLIGVLCTSPTVAPVSIICIE